MQVETICENYLLEETSLCTTNNCPTGQEETINNIIEKEGYLTYKVHTRRISTNGGNYLGILYEVDIKGETKHGYKETNLFVKIINGVDSKSFISIPNAYRVELFAYKELSVIFAELQEDANVPLQERFKMAKSYEDSNTEVIILDNLAKKGYNTYHRLNLVPLEFLKMSIKNLAKFHGLSFVLEKKRPDYFNEKIKVLKYANTFSDDWRGFIKSMFELTIKHVDDDVKDKVESTYIKVTDHVVKYFKEKSELACLCHGDYRPNNIMTKIVNGQVIDVIPIDYQIMSYSCPVLDFLYFIFSCTDRRMRKAHLSQLKDLYHETLTTFLEYFNIDVDSVYPKEKFEEAYKEKLDFGLCYSYVFMPIMLASEEDVPDLTKELTGISFEVDVMYKQRLRDAIDDFIEWGYM